MPSFQSLRDVDPAQFEQAADGYHAVSSAASEAKDRIAQKILAKSFPNTGSTTGDGLAGDAAAAAERRLERLQKNFHYTQVETGLISATLNGFASELRAAKKKLTTAIEEAQSAGFTVHDDGSISWTPDTPIPLGRQYSVTARDSTIPLADPDPTRAKAIGFADRIQAAIDSAAEADQEWSPKLAKLKAHNDLTVSAKDWANVHGDQRAVQKVAGDYLSKDAIPSGQSAKENREWWHELSDQQKSDYVSLYPASVGALDGLPAEVRDEANRTVMAEKEGRLHEQLNAIPPKPSHVYAHPGGSENRTWREVEDAIRNWEEKYGAEQDRISQTLQGINDIQARFSQTGQEGLPEAYLLGFDTDGTGRAIVANGNPDAADHTAVFVPGTTARLETVGGDITRMTDLWQAAQVKTPGENVSTISWLGYDPPQTIVPEAMNPSWAEDGAPILNDFLDGLEVAQGGDGASHTTVLGHSYGSSVVGQASNIGDLSADDIAVQGSPGMRVDNAADLDVGEEHVWAQAAGIDQGITGFDPVPVGGKLTPLPEREFKVDTWNGIPIDIGYNPTVPTDEAFDANVMTVDTPGHSHYWDPGSESLNNQAAVVAGEYEEVKRAS